MVVGKAPAFLRRIPLVMTFQGNVYPSFALAAVRRATESRHVSLSPLPGARSHLILDGRPVPLDERGTLLIRYPDMSDLAGTKLPPDSPFHDVVRRTGGSYRAANIFEPGTLWVAVKVLDDYPLVSTIAVPEDVLLEPWLSRTAVVLG